MTKREAMGGVGEESVKGGEGEREKRVLGGWA
jgi:hypothetical protein